MIRYRELESELCASLLQSEPLTGACEGCKLLMLLDLTMVYPSRPR